MSRMKKAEWKKTIVRGTRATQKWGRRGWAMGIFVRPTKTAAFSYTGHRLSARAPYPKSKSGTYRVDVDVSLVVQEYWKWEGEAVLRQSIRLSTATYYVCRKPRYLKKPLAFFVENTFTSRWWGIEEGITELTQRAGNAALRKLGYYISHEPLPKGASGTSWMTR